MTPETPARRFDYPLSLDLHGLRAVVVGGDHEALDKARRLVAAGAHVTIVAEAPGADLRGSGLPYEQRSFALSDVVDARVVIVAPDARRHAAALWSLRREGGFLLSSIDDPPHCDFASPAVVDVGDIKIALSSGGRAPAVLRRLREDLSRALNTGPVLAFIARVSALRDEPPVETRIARVKAAVSGFAIDVQVRFPPWFDEGRSGPGPSEE